MNKILGDGKRRKYNPGLADRLNKEFEEEQREIERQRLLNRAQNQNIVKVLIQTFEEYMKKDKLKWNRDDKIT